MRAALWAARGLAATFVLWVVLATVGTGSRTGRSTARRSPTRSRRSRSPRRSRCCATGCSRSTCCCGARSPSSASRRSASPRSRSCSRSSARWPATAGAARRRARRRAARGARRACASADRVDRMLYGHQDVSTAVARMGRGARQRRAIRAEALPGLARAAAETLGASGVRLDPDPRLGLAPVHVGGSARRSRRSSGCSATAARRSGGSCSVRARRARPYARGRPRARRGAQRGSSTLAVDAVALADAAPAVARPDRHRPRGGAPPPAPRPARRARARAGRDRAHAPGRAEHRRAEPPTTSSPAPASRLQDVVAEIRRIVHGAAPADPRRPRAGRGDPRARRPARAARGRARPARAARAAVRRRRARRLPDRHRGAHQRRPPRPRRARAGSRCAATAARPCSRSPTTGAGSTPDADPGVGLRSMRERAAELGGQVVLGEAPPGRAGRRGPAAERGEPT